MKKPTKQSQSVFNVEGYEPLGTELLNAYVQSSAGKGKERHSIGVGASVASPFNRQPILEISRMVGAGYPIGQIMKKAQEAMSMSARGENDRAIHELHGAMVYAAAACVLLRERRRD